MITLDMPAQSPRNAESQNWQGSAHGVSGQSLALRPYQHEALVAVRQAAKRGVQRMVVALPTGSGKCVTPSTLCWSNGLIRFGDLYGASMICGPDGPANVRGWYDDGVNAGLHVTTQAGWDIDGTLQHRIWVRTRDGFEGWKHLEALQLGDYVALARGQAHFGSTKIPLDEAYALGVLIADGCLIEHKSTKLLRVDKQRPLLEALIPVMHRWHAWAGGYANVQGVTLREFSLSHAVLQAYAPNFRTMLAERYGVHWAYSEDRVVPSSVLSGTRDVVQAFLRGYFDGDGYCHRNVQASTASPMLAEQIAHLLLGLGIAVRRHTKTTPHLPAHIVTVYDPEAFDACVRFTPYGLTKDQAFARLLATSRNTNIDIIPGIGSLLKQAAQHVPSKYQRDDGWRHIDAYYDGHKHPSYRFVRSLLPGLPACEAKQRLQTIVDRHYFWTPVTTLTPSVAHRIDCEVAKQHAFIGNGIVNHNTICFAHLVTQAAQRGNRALILVHRDELIHQTQAKLQAVAPGLPVGIVKAEQDDHTAPVVLASQQTLQRDRRRARLTPDFRVIIVDESHHCAPGNTWTTILHHFGGFTPGGPFVVGFTATPFRPNGRSILGPDGFTEIVYHRTILEMMVEGYLTDITAKRLYIEDFSLDQVRTSHGDYVSSDLDDALLAANAPHQIAEGLQQHAANRRSIIFSPGVSMAEAVTVACTAAGFQAATITGATPTEDRQWAYDALRRGAIQVLSSVMVLTEGFDEPSVDCVVIARPTRSKVLYIQMLGRALRPSPATGKVDALILDTTGATGRHNLLSVASILGLNDRQLDEQSVLDAVQEDEEPEEEGEGNEQEDLGLELPDGPVRSKSLSLLRRSALRWIPTPKGAYVLSMAGTMIRIRPASNAQFWRVEVKRQGARRYEQAAAALPLDWAFGVGEDTVRDLGLTKALNKDARWRQVPLSELSSKMATFAQHLGIEIRPGMTQGECSDAITAVTGDWYWR